MTGHQTAPARLMPYVGGHAAALDTLVARVRTVLPLMLAPPGTTAPSA